MKRTAYDIQAAIANLTKQIAEARAAGDLDRVDYLAEMRDGWAEDLEAMEDFQD
jgi:hypothetical protein